MIRELLWAQDAIFGAASHRRSMPGGGIVGDDPGAWDPLGGYDYAKGWETIHNDLDEPVIVWWQLLRLKHNVWAKQDLEAGERTDPEGIPIKMEHKVCVKLKYLHPDDELLREKWHNDTIHYRAAGIWTSLEDYEAIPLNQNCRTKYAPSKADESACFAASDIMQHPEEFPDSPDRAWPADPRIVPNHEIGSNPEKISTKFPNVRDRILSKCEDMIHCMAMNIRQ
eukprot:gnl/TRDRNA2_/TRDRNA2_172211_c1_seq2.p1 gnl/TRDRNA2_/TRDRNA2_172211_c1~~gnl/TRDRNA2_/TRDRNA2_172211_c1_seq2.p1  ORF type:complete len:225 (+),score=30.11 gnl/TRDRNA2_/TRDRNA2_172211_c1_seq2:13-687(+)